jgi:hypothetical protein
MSELTVPESMGGSGITYSSGSGTNGMASLGGYAYLDLLFQMLGEVITALQYAIDAGEGATNAANVNGTSVSSETIGSQGETATIQMVEADRAIVPGMHVTVADSAAPATNWMLVQVATWVEGTRTFTGPKRKVAGSGTKTAWKVSLSGPEGDDGTGDMTGQASSVDNELMLFSGTGGKTAKRGTGSGVVSVASGVVSVLNLDADTALTANSDTRLATQKATKAYVDAMVTGLLDFKGSTDCSANPNYPSALKGDAYVVSVAGKIGGASGTSVDIGDVYVASADNAGGTQASVGSSWFVLEHNLAGAALLNVAQAWTARQSMTPVSLTDAATVATDASLSNKFKVTLGGNRTLGNPTNMADGQSLQWRIVQDATGSRALAYASKFKFPGGAVPTLSTAANAVDYLFGEYDATSDTIVCNLVKAFA